jgi:hypothetical protein
LRDAIEVVLRLASGAALAVAITGLTQWRYI